MDVDGNDDGLGGTIGVCLFGAVREDIFESNLILLSFLLLRRHKNISPAASKESGVPTNTAIPTGKSIPSIVATGTEVAVIVGTEFAVAKTLTDVRKETEDDELSPLMISETEIGS
jgi:hypothetical protein